jgi:hypothetical protein
MYATVTIIFFLFYVLLYIILVEFSLVKARTEKILSTCAVWIVYAIMLNTAIWFVGKTVKDGKYCNQTSIKPYMVCQRCGK